MTAKKKPGPESIVREIKRNTRCKFRSEEKIRIVFEDLQGEERLWRSMFTGTKDSTTGMNVGHLEPGRYVMEVYLDGEHKMNRRFNKR